MIVHQIVGLTASVGVGGAKNDAEAVKHVIKLLSNLNSKIQCVSNNVQGLKEIVSDIPEGTINLHHLHS
jgi:hypothetical protein